MPFPEWMQIAFGSMKLPPDVFWNMTLSEWQAAVEGYQRSLGVKPKKHRVKAATSQQMISFFESIKK